MPSRRRPFPRRACERRRAALDRHARPGAQDRLSLRAAATLGALQGPTELLPISSSAHTTLIPWLAGWPYAELDGELRKSFEVALHAGAGVALAIDMRGELVGAARTLDRQRILAIALSLAPAAVAGYALERPIGRRLGGPRSIAAGLVAGAVGMALADLRPGHREGEAAPSDGLALGLAQAAALIPGVSRNGATLTAARARGFGRTDAQTLSWHAALPVIVGASALKALRLRRGTTVPDGLRPAFVAGAVSAFLSTLVSARVLRRPGMSARPLLPYAVYRCTIAAIVAVRLRRTQNTGR